MTTWLAVPGYEGYYEVSDEGEVRSLDRLVEHGYSGWILRRGAVVVGSWHGGYHTVCLSRDGRTKTRRVHVLVARAFKGPRPEGMVARHLNDVKKDNRAVNIAWGTSSDNGNDLVSNGFHHYAKRDCCKHGHLYTPENTLHNPAGKGRRCRECTRINSAKQRAKRKALK